MNLLIKRKNMKKDLYKTLEVEKEATQEEIKISYRKLASIHHPDKGGDENKFKELAEAYEVLNDIERRKKYDETGVTKQLNQVLIEEGFKQYILMQINGILQHFNVDVCTLDFVNVIKNVTRQNIDKFLETKEKLEQDLEKSNEIKNRLKIKEDEKDLILIVLENKISEIENNIVDCEEKIVLFNAYYSLLENYSYQKDEVTNPFNQLGNLTFVQNF